MPEKMVVNNNARRNRLITYLFNYAFDNDIGYVFCKKANPRYPSLAWKEEREIAINMNWHNQDVVPFTIGHEIGHIMLGKPNTKQLCCIAYGAQIEEEKDADIYSLHLLYRYSCGQEDNFYDPLSFVKAYGIPNRMIGEAYKMFAEDEG
ncbi:ImmA/IrrE family metallo-endopeptidase [Lactobacillus helveticus]|uniref:ImmA/IrrE family metallo-endopeptidase n=1 Tax=Lactobacillus helveticus TaxID=1587 RepID=UPI00345E1AEF